MANVLAFCAHFVCTCKGIATMVTCDYRSVKHCTVISCWKMWQLFELSEQREAGKLAGACRDYLGQKVHLPSGSVVFGDELWLSENPKKNKHGSSDSKIDTNRHHKALETLSHAVDVVMSSSWAAEATTDTILCLLLGRPLIGSSGWTALENARNAVHSRSCESQQKHSKMSWLGTLHNSTCGWIP